MSNCDGQSSSEESTQLSAATRSRRGRFATDASTRLEVFYSHWEQISMLLTQLNTPALTCLDDLDPVIHYLDQMMALLVEEKPADSSDSPGLMLQYILNQEVLEKLVMWSLESHGELLEKIKMHLLSTFETLISHSRQFLLPYKQVMKPLFLLLNACAIRSSVTVERQLVCVLHRVCVCLSRGRSYNDTATNVPAQSAVSSGTLLEMCRDVGLEVADSPLLVLALLVPFVHRESDIGQLARDGLLLMMALSAKNLNLANYIAMHSDFCPVLATGLSALFSSLPRKLEPVSDDWQQLLKPHWSKMPDLVLFLNSFDFCNAVIEVAHPMIGTQLLRFIYTGFLVPVLGSALHQSSLDEVIAATAYLDLFLRRLSQPSLLKIFLKFVLTETYDNYCVLDSLINRINSNTTLGIVTLSLFRTLLSFHCEDVMFHLIFKYLIPCGHLLSSQRRVLRDPMGYGKSADRFLTLIPRCCSAAAVLQPDQERPAPAHPDSDVINLQSTDVQRESGSESYLQYLYDSSLRIQERTVASINWVFRYDGEDPPPNAFDNINNDDDNTLDDFQNTFSSGTTVSPLRSTDSLDSPIDCSMDDSQSWNVANTRIQELCQAKPMYKLSYWDTDTLNDDSSIDSLQIFSQDDELTSKKQLHKRRRRFSPGSLSAAFTPLFMGSEPPSVELFMNVLNSFPTPPESPSGVKEEENHIFTAIDAWLTSASTDNEDMSLEAILRDSASRQVLNATTSAAVNNQKPYDSNTIFSLPFQIQTKDLEACPNVGPFLTTLLCRLESMPGNSLYVNLLLTGLLTDLSCYPQPLLKSFLVNTTLVLQPAVKSLFQILSSIKQRLDSFATGLDDSKGAGNFASLLNQGSRYLAWRMNSAADLNSPPVGILEPDKRATTQVSDKEPKRRSGFFKRLLAKRGRQSSNANSSDTNSSTSDSLAGPSSMSTGSVEVLAKDCSLQSVRTRNMVYCALIFEEFCKELSSISREHQVRPT